MSIGSARGRVRAAGAGLAALTVTTALAAPAPASVGAVRAAANASGPCAKASHGKVRFPLGRGKHVVFAVAPAYGSSHATVTECVKHRDGSWHRILRTSGRVGSKGYAPPRDKREGDGRSPSGSYSIDRAFGLGDPGTRLGYHKLRKSAECWGSTAGTPQYNRYFHGACRDTDEDLVKIAKSGEYRQAAVINYNRPPDSPVRHGYGSAIFLHINESGATSGCVSVPASGVRSILRTLHPGDHIVMGTRDALFG